MKTILRLIYLYYWRWYNGGEMRLREWREFYSLKKKLKTSLIKKAFRLSQKYNHE